MDIQFFFCNHIDILCLSAYDFLHMCHNLVCWRWMGCLDRGHLQRIDNVHLWNGNTTLMFYIHLDKTLRKQIAAFLKFRTSFYKTKAEISAHSTYTNLPTSSLVHTLRNSCHMHQVNTTTLGFFFQKKMSRNILNSPHINPNMHVQVLFSPLWSDWSPIFQMPSTYKCWMKVTAAVPNSSKFIVWDSGTAREDLQHQNGIVLPKVDSSAALESLTIMHEHISSTNL